MTRPNAIAARPTTTRRRLSPIQRQVAWLALPITAGIISAVHVLVNGPHPDALFTWLMTALTLTPGAMKMLAHQLRTDDGFWLSQSVSTAGTVITTAVSYLGLWVGALVVVGVVEVYANPAAAPGTLALSAAVTVFAPLARLGWRRLGRPERSAKRSSH